ncbi:MAG: 3-oxoacyl-ACP reductase FabG [Clostridiales bacterium]|nr:3-oxoacyl-ACP reductase FabG [Clostridiales bacterium]
MENFNTALITGATRGIGRAIAIALAKNGYNIAFSYINSDDKANELKKEIEGLGVKALAVKSDVSDFRQVEDMFCKVRKTMGRICVLVNNAGIAQQKMINDVSVEEWNKIISTDLSGTFYCCKAVIDDMLHFKKGRIINISSMWGLVGASCEVPYSAAKAGVIGLTKALAKELGPSGITVNAVAPGVIDTDMNANLSKDDMEQLKEDTPLMKIGKPEDIADTVAFLASDKAEFITGQVISVNGGFVIN